MIIRVYRILSSRTISFRNPFKGRHRRVNTLVPASWQEDLRVPSQAIPDHFSTFYSTRNSVRLFCLGINHQYITCIQGCTVEFCAIACDSRPVISTFYSTRNSVRLFSLGINHQYITCIQGCTVEVCAMASDSRPLASTFYSTRNIVRLFCLGINH